MSEPSRSRRARWREPATVLAAVGVVVALLTWLVPVSPGDGSAGEGDAPASASSGSPPANPPPNSTTSEAPVTTTGPPPAESKRGTSGPAATPARSPNSPLYLNVDGTYSQYKVRPNQYRADRDIKFTVHVSDDVGEVSTGCYATITAIQNGVVIKKDESGCYPGYGWINLHAGTYTLQFDVTTDWGASGRNSVEIQMVA